MPRIHYEDHRRITPYAPNDAQEDDDESPEDDLNDLAVVVGVAGTLGLTLLIAIVTASLMR
jgi:hypothetical protein